MYILYSVCLLKIDINIIILIRCFTSSVDEHAGIHCIRVCSNNCWCQNLPPRIHHHLQIGGENDTSPRRHSHSRNNWRPLETVWGGEWDRVFGERSHGAVAEDDRSREVSTAASVLADRTTAVMLSCYVTEVSILFWVDFGSCNCIFTIMHSYVNYSPSPHGRPSQTWSKRSELQCLHHVYKGTSYMGELNITGHAVSSTPNLT